MKSIMNLLAQGLTLFAVASLTLGLAPFVPEPHIVANLRWVAGGAVGMTSENWLDLLMHGTPWLLLILSLIARLKLKVQKPVGLNETQT